MKVILITIGFFALILIPFALFSNFGWPGGPDSCVRENDAKIPSATDNTCYCEPFRLQDIGTPGARQPFNTYSNLYVLLTAPFLIFLMWWYQYRAPEAPENIFRRIEWYQIFYIQVAVFLGLGSMWFHASIVGWGGMFDQMSMYTLIDFLLCFTLVRLTGNGWWFVIGYPIGFVLFFIIALLGVMEIVVIPSAAVIGICLAPYALGEFRMWWRDGRGQVPLWEFGKYWFIGLGAFLIAVVIRGISNTGGPLCINSSAFQFHGLWHWLCGLTAVMLYLHWSRAKH